MSKATRFLKTMSTLALLPAFLGAGTLPAASAQEQITAEKFVTQLDSQSQAQWGTLNAQQRQEVIKTVNDPRFRPGLSQKEAQTISADIKVSPVKTGAKTGAGQTPQFGAIFFPKITYVGSAFYEVDTSLYGIKLGSNRLDYSFYLRSGKVTSNKSCVATYKQVVPNRSVSVKASNSVKDGLGTCKADWTISTTKGQAQKEVWEQGLTVKDSKIQKTWITKK
ncbi:MAG: hypothetical protein Q4C74_00925 [Rothia sp. (in: high G+C Gram-positive bacteria)]|nr:hypothetical protein [Rothia sp. (in: high G+C Gram-positive bacteria)]